MLNFKAVNTIRVMAPPPLQPWTDSCPCFLHMPQPRNSTRQLSYAMSQYLTLLFSETILEYLDIVP